MNENLTPNKPVAYPLNRPMAENTADNLPATPPTEVKGSDEEQVVVVESRDNVQNGKTEDRGTNGSKKDEETRTQRETRQGRNKPTPKEAEEILETYKKIYEREFKKKYEDLDIETREAIEKRIEEGKPPNPMGGANEHEDHDEEHEEHGGGGNGPRNTYERARDIMRESKYGAQYTAFVNALRNGDMRSASSLHDEAAHELSTELTAVEERIIDAQNNPDPADIVKRNDITNLLGEMAGIKREITPAPPVDKLHIKAEELISKRERGEEWTAHDREEVIEYIEEMNPAGYQVDEGDIDFIARDDEFSERYLDLLLSLPESQPRSGYHLGFHEGNNLEAFMHKVKEHDPKRLQRYSDERGMRQNFHEMRRYMLVGNIRDFSTVARDIPDTYIQAATDYVGVNSVQRFYDTVFKEAMAKKQTISPQDFKHIEERLEKLFRDANESGVFNIEQKGEDGNPLRDEHGNIATRALREWEINRAINVGRNFSAIKLRLPELISVGEIPSNFGTPSVPETFVSFDYESAVRFLNPLRFLGSKFGIGAVRGGQEYLKKLFIEIDAQKNSQAKFTKLFGIDRKNYERSAPFGNTSFDSGWRIPQANLNVFKIMARVRDEKIYDEVDNKEMILKVYDPTQAEQEVEAGYYIDHQTRYIRELRKRGLKDPQISAQYDHNAAIKQAVEKLPFYRGFLASYGNVPIEAKVEAWKKIAEDMPNQVMMILKGNASFDALKASQGMTEEKMETLQRKLALYQELRLQAQMRETKLRDDGSPIDPTAGITEKDPNDPEGHRRIIRNVTLNEIITSNPIHGDNSLSPDELRFIDAMKTWMGHDMQEGGGTVYKNLAEVKWPINPINEDFAYETADYTRTGAEVFRRRIGGDAVALYQAAEEVIPILRNPNMAFETYIEHMQKAADAIDTPHGYEAAQNMLFTFHKTKLDFTRKDKIWESLPGIDEAASYFGVPVSEAQRWFGKNGAAYDTFQTRALIEQLVGAGLIRRHKEIGEDKPQIDKLRKALRATLPDILVKRIPIGGIFILLIIISEFTKRALKEK